MRKLFHWKRGYENSRWGSSTLHRSWQIVPRLLLLVCSFALKAQDVPRNNEVGPLPELPEAKSPFTFFAENDPVTGQRAFSFDGKRIPPVIRSSLVSKI